MEILILQAGSLLGGLGEGAGIGSSLALFQTILMWGVVGSVVFGLMGVFLARRFEKKRFNIKLNIVVPRSDGRIIEWYEGLGAFTKSKRVGGITSFLIKRPGIAKSEIPPPSSDYLIAPNNTMLLAQKGIDDYEPIMPHDLSMVVVKDKIINGVQKYKKVPILKLHAINQEATAWGFDIEETAKRRFTFASLWEKYQMMITMMTFVFILFLVLYINWIGMKDVVTGLAEVAQILRSSTAPIITPGG